MPIKPSSSPPIRIAMWSGPRNISTAMMRSWGNRPDTIVCDEPLYAHYLKITGKDHPGREEIIEHHDADWQSVVRWLTEDDLPSTRTIFYQKHMAHHLLPDVGRDWMSSVVNCFLIRDPREMILSLAKVIPDARIEDTGLPQQVEMFDRVCQETGMIPPVLDARDVLEEPDRMMRRLCEALDVAFMETMMYWPAGIRETDGIWARHWYDSVEVSTKFARWRPRTAPLPANMIGLLDEAQSCYDHLSGHRISRDP